LSLATDFSFGEKLSINTKNKLKETTLVICCIAMAQYGTGYKITCAGPRVSVSVVTPTAEVFLCDIDEILPSGSGPEK